jgi:hypothetical protein
MIHLDNRPSDFNLDTIYETRVFRNNPIIDPKVIENIIKDENVKREHYDYSSKSSAKANSKSKDSIQEQETVLFVKDVASNFLKMYDYTHDSDEWYMDVIRYNLQDEVNQVDSGLAWHCENDNYPDLITILLYLRVDEGIKKGNLRYIDYHDVKQTISITSDTIIIMDGRVYHKPENPNGTGKRDLIAISFKRQ